MPHTLLAHQQLHGHGVQHLVAHHHALELRGQFVHPTHLVGERLERVLLTRAQAARQIDDGVALDARPQGLKQLQRQSARSCAKFPDFVGLSLAQSLRHLVRQGAAKPRRELGRRHKIAAAGGRGAKFAQLVGVIAQTRRVQSQRHEMVKRQPPARGLDAVLDNSHQRTVVRIVRRIRCHTEIAAKRSAIVQHLHPTQNRSMSSHVLITGGSKRLGAELVRSFARAGWHVWCHYQHSQTQAMALQKELTQAGHSVNTVYADLSQEADLLTMMDSVRAQAGVLRCVVNNASAFDPDTGLSMDTHSANAQLQVNLLAPLMLGRELAKHAQAHTDHSVIHVLDQKVFNLNPDYFSYTVSKLALERSVALQAQSLAPHVRVCGVAPGLMYPSGPQTQDNFERASRINLLRRAIRPQDVANTCVFLAENAAITGSTVCVDNGQHLVGLTRDVMFMVDQPTQDHP